MAQTYGSCLCSEVKFEVVGSLEGFFLCHCKHCQKGSGSSNAANIFSQSAQVLWLKGEERVKTYVLPGTRHTKAFCQNCGSGLPNLQRNGKLLVIPAGSLDSEIVLRPTAHIFFSSRAAWERELDQIQVFDKLPE